MTAIIAVKETKGIFVAADSMVTCGNHYYVSPFSKIVRKKNMLLAVAGNGNILECITKLDLSILNDHVAKSVPPTDFLSCVFLPYLKSYMDEEYECGKDETQDWALVIAYKDDVYTVGGDYCLVNTFDGIVSEGSGVEAAKAAYLALREPNMTKGQIKKNLLRALAICEGIVTSVRRPFTVEEL